MGARFLLLCVLGSTAAVIPAVCNSAPTIVAAADYGLQISHAGASRSATTTKSARAAAKDLRLNIANLGRHDLFDVRIYLQQIGPTVIVDRQQPVRVQKLPRGAKHTIAWTYEPRRSLNDALPRAKTDALRNVVFRVEAVDKTTQKIVKFYIQSTEAR